MVEAENSLSWSQEGPEKDRESLIRNAMYRKNGRVGIMAEYPKEVTTDIPEHAYLKDDPYTNWDERARGLGKFQNWYQLVNRPSQSASWYQFEIDFQGEHCQYRWQQWEKRIFYV